MEKLSYYPLYWREDFCSSSHGNAKNSTCLPGSGMGYRACRNAITNPKPTVYLNLENSSGPLGKIVIELRADVVPIAAENFRCLCTGEKGFSYKCSEIHRIIPGLWWQSGIIAKTNCSFSHSIYGDYFMDENFV